MFRSYAFDQACSSSPVHPSTECEPYRILEDGHIQNQDGFVVPRSFQEFHVEFPLHVHHFVRRHMPHASHADREDRESELNLYLMTVPLTSKFRVPGANGFAEGCRDRIQTFAPERAYGASKPRFLNFINSMLTNYFITLTKRAVINPICWSGNALYMPGRESQPDPGNVSDEYVHSHQYPRPEHWGRETTQLDDPLLIEQFRQYLAEHSPELQLLFCTLVDADSFLQAQHQLGMTEQLFTRARNRLRVLIDCFHDSRTVPMQRKVYLLRSRVSAATVEDIRLRAYALWEARGWRGDGETENWLDAERELAGSL